MPEFVPVPIGSVAPVQGVFAFPDESVKRRPRPITNPLDQAVLEGIDVDVVDAAFEVGFVAAGVFEESSLPNTVLPFLLPAERRGLHWTASLQPSAGESRFDQFPTRRVIGVARWQSPNGVQVVRQKGECNDLKWILAADSGERFAQTIAGQFRCKNLGPSGRYHREEIDTSLSKTPIAAHLESITFAGRIPEESESPCPGRFEIHVKRDGGLHS